MDELDIYYRKHESDDLFKIIFQRISDDGYMPILLRIIKSNPDFNIKLFDGNYFSEPLLKHYPFEFLVKALGKVPVPLLESGTRDEEIKEKIIYLIDYIHLSSIAIDLFYCDDFTIEFFDKLVSVFDRFEQICLFKLLRIRPDYSVALVKEALKYDCSIFNLKFIITHFEEQNFNLNILFENNDILFSKSFTIFIKTIKSSFFSPNLRFGDFVQIFKQYEHFFVSETIIEHSEAVTRFLCDVNRDKYRIKNAFNFEAFDQIRYNYHFNNNSSNNEITKSYLNITYEQLKQTINRYLSRNKIKRFLSDNEIQILTSFLNAENILELMHNNFQIFENIENRFRELCKKDLANNLFTVHTNEPVINISRTFFNVLAHRIRSNSANKMALKLLNDITEWDKNFVEDSYLSTSMIDQYFLGLIEGGNYLLGFSDILPEDIIDMGYIDIYSSIYLYRNQIKNDRSTFDLIEELKNYYPSGYSEVTLRRFRGNIAIQPNRIITMDQVTEFSKNAASYFKVPIMLIDSYQSASFMNDHNQALLIQERIIDYAKYLFKMYVSFSTNYDIVAKYFNAKTINNTVNELLRRCKENKDENFRNAILFLISVLERINSNNHNLEYYLEPIDTKEFRRKLVL